MTFEQFIYEREAAKTRPPVIVITDERAAAFVARKVAGLSESPWEVLRAITLKGK